MVDPAGIVATLEAVAERRGDPGPDIYRRLFAQHPAFERLFVMDTNGDVRASMVQQGFACILDYVGERLTAPQIIGAERQRHDGYGVPEDQFDAFFTAMRDVFRDIMGADWTPAMERAWAGLLAEFAAIR